MSEVKQQHAEEIQRLTDLLEKLAEEIYELDTVEEQWHQLNDAMLCFVEMSYDPKNPAYNSAVRLVLIVHFNLLKQQGNHLPDPYFHMHQIRKAILELFGKYQAVKRKEAEAEEG